MHHGGCGRSPGQGNSFRRITGRTHCGRRVRKHSKGKAGASQSEKLSEGRRLFSCFVRSRGASLCREAGDARRTFITARERMEAMRFELFCTPVVETLRELGVDAQLSGRNDLSVDGRKFSGNSQYTSGGRLLHHGTILFAADLETMTAALTPPYEKLQSKGTPSVRGRVLNLSEALGGRVSLEEFRRLLANRALRGRTCSRFSLTADDWVAIDKLAREKYGSWEWNYGDSPPCSFSVKAYWNGCGTVEARVLLREGRIETVTRYRLRHR